MIFTHRRSPAPAALVSLTLAAGCGGGPPAGVVPSPTDPPASAYAGPSCREAEFDTVVAFPDPNLEQAIRSALHVGADEALTCALLARLTRLHAPDARIQNLAGIENLVRLSELYVYGNNSIRDVTPLSLLPALADLNLARNAIEDIGPLAQVRTLTSLDLLGNPIRDISPLSGLTGLTRLRIQEVPGLANLEPLRPLVSLTRLELGGNAIVDIRPLAALTRLTRLSLQGNPHLSDIRPLAHLLELEIVSLGGTAVADIGVLAGLSRLTTIGLEDTRVSDLGSLLGLEALSRLDLRGNMQLSDIRPLLFHPAFGVGDAVRVEDSGVTCTDVVALVTKGVSVLSTCR